MKQVVLLALDGYKKFISPIFVTLFGQGCKYQVTCSTYAKEVISDYGVLKGSLLAGKRFLTCNNFS